MKPSVLKKYSYLCEYIPRYVVTVNEVSNIDMFIASKQVVCLKTDHPESLSVDES